MQLSSKYNMPRLSDRPKYATVSCIRRLSEWIRNARSESLDGSGRVESLVSMMTDLVLPYVDCHLRGWVLSGRYCRYVRRRAEKDELRKECAGQPSQ